METKEHRKPDAVRKVSVEGGDVVTYTFGSGDEVIFLLHGSPAPADYLWQTHGYLADHGYKVVIHDQLGVGKSDKPDDPSLWNIERYVREVETVRIELGLGKVQLYGHSWGASLLIEYALTYPDNVKSLIIASGAGDINFHRQESDRLLSAFGPEFVRMRRTHEIRGTTDSEEYRASNMLMMCRHVIRMPKWPQEMIESRNSLKDEDWRPYKTLVGEEWAFTGTMRNWNRLPDMHKIKQPTLILVGEYDECTPNEALKMQLELPNSKIHLFQNAAHRYMYECPEEYLAVTEKFWAENRR